MYRNIGSLDDFKFSGKLYVVVCKYSDVGWKEFEKRNVVCRNEREAALNIKEALSEFDLDEVALLTINLDSGEQHITREVDDIQWCKEELLKEEIEEGFDDELCRKWGML